MRASAFALCVALACHAALAQDHEANAGALVVEEPAGQPLPASPSPEASDGERPADAPDEFDVRVLGHRIEKSEAIVLRLWEAAIESRSAGGDAEIVREMEEKATRLTLETKGLRRRRDELRRQLSPVPHTEPVPRPGRDIRRTTPFGNEQLPDDGVAPPRDFEEGRSSGRRGPTLTPPVADDVDPQSPENPELSRLRAENEALRRQNAVLKELVRKRLSSESQGRTGDVLAAPIEQQAPPE